LRASESGLYVRGLVALAFRIPDRDTDDRPWQSR